MAGNGGLQSQAEPSYAPAGPARVMIEFFIPAGVKGWQSGSPLNSEGS